MIELEISYKKGQAYAGYLHLRTFKGIKFEGPQPRLTGSIKSKPLPVGIVLDFVTANDQLIGIEILAFNEEVVAQIETVLVENQIPFESSDLAPILRG